tara:strand:+ start:55 stop:246 length:192 start_codon:yes stop_codon:yes gene_type:complete
MLYLTRHALATFKRLSHLKLCPVDLRFAPILTRKKSFLFGLFASGASRRIEPRLTIVAVLLAK